MFFMSRFSDVSRCRRRLRLRTLSPSNLGARKDTPVAYPFGVRVSSTRYGSFDSLRSLRMTESDLQASVQDTRRRFLAMVDTIRPALHRFCSRMCGSVLDGEDVVQETLAQAFYYLSSLRDESRLEP